MTPQEHYTEAERLLLALDAIGPDAPDDFHERVTAEAQVHATLALAGFTRDAAAIVERASTPIVTIPPADPGQPFAGRPA